MSVAVPLVMPVRDGCARHRKAQAYWRGRALQHADELARLGPAVLVPGEHVGQGCRHHQVRPEVFDGGDSAWKSGVA
jgi:hypothetical protein